jgi:hypothetical protein
MHTDAAASGRGTPRWSDALEGAESMERRRSKFALGLLGALGLAGLAACGSSDPLPFAQLETSTLQAVCHLDVLCGDYPDQASCLASHQVYPQSYYDTLGQDIQSGKVVYDGNKARACLDKINAASCTRDGPSPRYWDPNCLTIFTGTVPIGGACFFGEECTSTVCQATDTTCSALTQCCPGTCQDIPPPVGVGGPCPSLPATCPSGTICVIDAYGGLCLATVGVGQPCPATVVCAQGLYCDPVDYHCKAPVGAGGACNPARDSTDCDFPDTCDATTSVCTPPLAVGAACDPTNSACIPYASCDTATATCVARPAVGAACDPTGTGPSCLDGTCDATTATCTLTTNAGACS